MSGAEFSIDGDAFANLGYDAAHSQVLDLQLEGEPTARKVVFSQVQKSEGAPDLVFSPANGQPATPGGVVQTTMPASGRHTWIVRCQINDGVDASAKSVQAWTKERAVAIRGGVGPRKICPAESTQYDATYGWSSPVNELIDSAVLLGTYPAKTAEYTAQVGERVRCDPSSAGFIVNLPAAAAAGREAMIGLKIVVDTANAVTVTPNGSDTIDGQATWDVDGSGDRGALLLISNGVDDWELS